MQVLGTSEPLVANGKIAGRSPRDGAALEPVDTSAASEVLRVVAAAREAQRVWAEHSPRDRAKRLKRLKPALLERGDRLAEIALAEQGKSAAETYLSEVLPSADLFSYWAAQTPRLLLPEAASLNPINYRRKAAVTELVPKGVIALITPWNYPLSIPLRTLVPALAAGNAVVLKPSEYAARVGAEVAALFEQLGIPGLVGLVQGAGDVGAQLVGAEVDHVVFTGSVATGRKVATACAERLVTCSLELGGKDPALVLADANLDRAAEGIVWSAFANAGQNCASVERVYVVEAVAQQFVEKVLARTERLVLGDGQSVVYDVGPLVRSAGLQTVERHVSDALSAGATIRVGGKATGVGLHFEPTVLTDVDDEMAVMTEETFGPVMPIAVVRDEAEAIARANRSVFGLSASIWTRNVERGRKIAARLRCGVVTINNHSFTAALPHAPWHGRGHSGGGVTNSRFAFFDLVEPRYVLVDRSETREIWWFPHNTAVTAIARALARLMGRSGNQVDALLTLLRQFAKRWK